MTPEDDKGTIEPCCSFCSKPRSAVRKLISSKRGHFICDECVHHYSDQIKQDREPKSH